MSEDLERFAKWYSKLGDKDIAKILEGAAEVSRRRGRPLHLEIPDTEHSEAIKRYEGIQMTIIKTFRDLSKPYLYWETPFGPDRLTWDMVAERVNKEVSSQLTADVPLLYLLLPTHEDRNWNEQFAGRASQLRLESRGINSRLKSGYNRILFPFDRSMSTLGEIWEAGEETIESIRNAGKTSTIFMRKAFSIQPTSP